ncbi:MAG: hypothetical protein P4L31_06980 [Candidatus Babeliales bacterium]|nr:hypothetical protein [Candidatus Babeliales bacterium]
MSSLNKALLLTLIVSTVSTSVSALESTSAFKNAYNCVAAGVNADAHSLHQAAKNHLVALEQCASNSVIAKETSSFVALAKKNLMTLPAAFEQSANNALDCIKANKAATAGAVIIAASLTVIAYNIYKLAKKLSRVEPKPKA